MNMAAVIEPKSDQINADDLQGRTITVTITDVKFKGGQEQPVSLSLAGSDKVYRPCKSMCRVLVAGWGLDASQYTGKSLTLYCDPTVKFGPLAVGGIRISHMSHIDGEMQMALTATKGVKKAYRVKPLVMDKQPAASKADRAAEGVKAWLARIADGEDVTADEGYADRMAWLRANRPELAAEIDAAIGAPADGNPFGEGPSDDDRGETNAIDATEIIAFINAKVTAMDVNSMVSSHRDAIDRMSEDDQQAIRDAAMEKIEAIKQAARK